MKIKLSDFIKKLKIVPAWVILVLDLLIVYLSSLLSLFIRDNFFIHGTYNTNVYIYAPFLFLLIHTLFFVLFRTYNMVIRYTTSKDVLKIFYSSLSTTVSFFIINIISLSLNNSYLIPTSVLLMEFFITISVTIIIRFIFKVYYLDLVNPVKDKKNIAILGAGNTGIITKRVIDNDVEGKYNVAAFFDNDVKKIGKNIENIQVRSISTLDDYLKNYAVFFLIVAIQKVSTDLINEVTEIALANKVKILRVPPANRWINGSLSFKQIKKIKIDDLLDRAPIQLDNKYIDNDIRDKVIMITGAAGSIGSEIVNQVMRYKYKRIILVDNAETPMFYLYNKCYNYNKMTHIETELASIVDEKKIEQIIEKYRPDLIYHAAAYKHVSMMEFNVGAAIKTNIKGTKVLADLAVKYGVEKFVMISTDKAVNPTSVMGASKRVAEMYVQALNFAQDTTKFITTRFGNVLGSNGSVIPIFYKQIESGGPVTVTHRDVTRYFMTIPEACQLVLNAGAMGEGGEIFIFDMGKSIKIYDLAVKMINLSGLVLGKDIQIEFTGLGHGEKLYEELLANEENTIKTNHKQIMIAKVRQNEYTVVKEQISDLIRDLNKPDDQLLVKLQQIVPEFSTQK